MEPFDERRSFAKIELERFMPKLRAKLIGTWSLKASQWRDANGRVESPLGSEPVGLLMYAESGAASVQLMRPNQPNFADDDWRRASEEEKASAWLGYFCYFGTFTVDEAAGTVTHYVKGSWFPNLVGTEQLRAFAFEGNALALTAESSLGRITLVWERVPSGGGNVSSS